MLLEALVNQEGGGGIDFFWLLLPLLCCLMLMAQSRGGGGRSQASSENVTESWYTPQDIETTYKEIEAAVGEWRKEKEEKKETDRSFISRLRRGRKAEESFVAKETIPPRLYRVSDASGPLYFELTEVEGGGTVVNSTFNSAIKSKVARFKAKIPIKIPATPVGIRCPACGKPVLPEFNLCPYCGSKLIKE